jgi:elongation factor G
MDRERASFEQACKDLAEALEQKPVPVQLPIGAEGGFKGVVDLLRGEAFLGQAESGQMREAEIPAELADEARAARDRLIESVAESNDALLEKYLEGGELSEEELRTGLRDAIARGAFLPVLCGAGGSGHRVLRTLLDFVVAYCPTAGDLAPALGVDPRSGDEVTRAPQTSEPSRRRSCARSSIPSPASCRSSAILSGQIAGDAPIYNATREVKEKLGHLFKLEGKKQSQVARAVARRLVAVAKLKEAATGDTLCDEKVQTAYPLPAQLRVRDLLRARGEVEGRGGQDRRRLHRLQEEDPALHLDRDPQTKDILLGGVGQLHVEVAIERLKRKFGCDVILKAPKVPYKETIKAKAQARAASRSRPGGHGQFADTWLEVEPVARGNGFEFVDKIVGGVIRGTSSRRSRRGYARR